MKLIQIKPGAALFGVLLGLNDQPGYLAPSFFIGGENACSCHAVRFATLWRKHGADVSYWSVIGGEVGNYAFVARFDSVEAYGRTLAAMGADPAFAEFQAKRLKAGQSDWVRSNMAIQVDI